MSTGSSLEAELLKIELIENGKKKYHSPNSVFSAAFDFATVDNYYPIYSYHRIGASQLIYTGTSLTGKFIDICHGNIGLIRIKYDIGKTKNV